MSELSEDAGSQSQEEVLVLRVFLDEGGDERAARDHFVAALADPIERAAGERAADPLASEDVRNDRVRKRDHSGLPAIGRERHPTFGLELETTGTRIVSDHETKASTAVVRKFTQRRRTL